MSLEFRKALEVFNDSIIAQQLLELFENPFPKGWQNLSIDSSVAMEQRFKLLAKELESWVILKSQEMAEFEGDDLIRLHGEAVGCMYAIREFRRHFNELQNT